MFVRVRIVFPGEQLEPRDLQVVLRLDAASERSRLQRTRRPGGSQDHTPDSRMISCESPVPVHAIWRAPGSGGDDAMVQDCLQRRRAVADHAGPAAAPQTVYADRQLDRYPKRGQRIQLENASTCLVAALYCIRDLQLLHAAREPKLIPNFRCQPTLDEFLIDKHIDLVRWRVQGMQHDAGLHAHLDQELHDPTLPMLDVLHGPEGR